MANNYQTFLSCKSKKKSKVLRAQVCPCPLQSSANFQDLLILNCWINYIQNQFLL